MQSLITPPHRIPQTAHPNFMNFMNSMNFKSLFPYLCTRNTDRIEELRKDHALQARKQCLDEGCGGRKHLGST